MEPQKLMLAVQERASRFVALCLASVLLAGPGVAPAAEIPGFDEVLTKDGSRIFGKILSMSGGSLDFEGAFGGKVSIPWKDVVSLKTANPIVLVLSDGSRIKGWVAPGAEGSVEVRAETIAGPSTVALAQVAEINPKFPIAFKGNLSLGASVARGNTETKAFSVLAEFEARSAQQRLTLRGSYNYAESETEMIAQNGKASIKYDYFVWERLYAYASAYFEHDGIQDLRLRTALSAGPGYQVIDKGDFDEVWLKGMQLLVEVGVSYVNEDYKGTEDSSRVAGRWSVKFDWPVWPDRITLFHYHEAYPNFEDLQEDFYITTEQGVRFNIVSNFVATAQVNFRWDSDPAPGFRRGDVLYLLTIGYAFEY
ncbi:MAG: DUF481 domain-containing protein [Planctomycetota bacterium]